MDHRLWSIKQPILDGISKEKYKCVYQTDSILGKSSSYHSQTHRYLHFIAIFIEIVQLPLLMTLLRSENRLDGFQNEGVHLIIRVYR